MPQAKLPTPNRRTFERHHGPVPIEQWEAGHALWRILRHDVLMNPDGAMRILVPLIARAARADELEAKAILVKSNHGRTDFKT